MRPVLATIAIAAALATACASSGTSVKSAEIGKRTNVVTLEEIQGVTASTAYDLIQRLRPSFLRQVGAVTLKADGPGARDVVVFVDGMPIGERSVLREIPAQDVARIERLTASEATTRFGTGFPHGAILITTHRRQH